MYLDPHLTTYILEAFAKPFGIGDHHVDVAVFVVIIVVSLVSSVDILGLTDTVPIVDICLKSV